MKAKAVKKERVSERLKYIRFCIRYLTSSSRQKRYYISVHMS